MQSVLNESHHTTSRVVSRFLRLPGNLSASTRINGLRNNDTSDSILFISEEEIGIRSNTRRFESNTCPMQQVSVSNKQHRTFVTNCANSINRRAISDHELNQLRDRVGRLRSLLRVAIADVELQHRPVSASAVVIISKLTTNNESQSSKMVQVLSANKNLKATFNESIGTLSK
jgi:hypothetical protein